MPSDPLVSIVIPVYNGEKTIKECLDSVLNQSYPNYEIIVINNNSTDRTNTILKHYETTFPSKIHCIFEEKRSRGAARNAGIQASSGEIIAMIDADCVAYKDWLQELTDPIRAGNETVVRGFLSDLHSNYWRKQLQRAEEKFLKRSLQGNYIKHLGCGNFAIVAKIMKQFLFDPDFVAAEDFDLALRLRKEQKIRYLPIAIDHYNRNSLSSVWKQYVDRAFWTAAIYKKHKDTLTDPTDDIMTESLAPKQLITFPFWLALQLLTNPPKESFFIFFTEIAWRTGLLMHSFFFFTTHN